MIGRKSTKAIADAYFERFTYLPQYSSRALDKNSLYDFLYVSDFDGWVLNNFKAISSARGLAEFIMRLHTGESLAKVTPEWMPEARKLFGQRLLRDLAQSILVARQEPGFESYYGSDSRAVDAMEKQLELDGYLFRDGMLLVPEETVLDEAEEQGVLVALSTSADLSDVTLIRHHLGLSEEHYASEKWDDSISNSRKVLEAILSQTAVRIAGLKGTALDPGKLERPAWVRDYLVESGLLDAKEKAAIASTYSLLSDTGGHPNIAHRDQARLMRHLALTYSQFVLLRLEERLRAAS